MSDSEPTPGPSHSKKRTTSDLMFLSSPMKKRTRGDMGSREKMIVINIYKYVEKTFPTYPIKNEITRKTAEIVGVSVATVHRILSEYRMNGKFTSPERSTPKFQIVENLDEFTLSVIRRKVHQFYLNNELPTVDKLLKNINDDEDLPSFKRSTLYKILKKLNFRFSKRSRKSILLDRPDLTIWRRKYLMQIKDFRRQNRKIYYTDETWLNEGHTCNYVWVDDDITSSRQAFLKGLSTGLKNPQKGKRLIICHIGSTDGFLEGGELIFEAKKTDREGDYHSEMDAHNFEKWFKKVLDLVEPGSVIVLDNAPYHSRLADKPPNMAWRKADIQAWLLEKQIIFDEAEVKAELLQKINKENYKKKVVDEMAAEKNVITLRLPPYHCELNPIELIWAQLKGHVGKNNKSFKMAEVKELISEGLRKITSESWTKCIEHIIKEETKMMELDGLMDLATDQSTTPFIINLNENSDSDTEPLDSCSS